MPDAHEDPEPHADAYGYGDHDPDGDAYEYAHRDRDADRNLHPDAYPHYDAIARAEFLADANSHPAPRWWRRLLRLLTTSR